MIKQRILTPPIGTILQCLIDAQKRGERIVSVCPHFSPAPSDRWYDPHVYHIDGHIKKWGLDERPDGVYICRGEHPKYSPCEWLHYTPNPQRGMFVQTTTFQTGYIVIVEEGDDPVSRHREHL